MGYERTSQPGTEPVTLSELKEQAVVSGSTDDALLTRLIKVARYEAENITGRTLMTSSWVRTLDSFPDAIQLLKGPVLGITDIKYDDENGNEQTLSSADYTLDKGGGMLAYVVPAYNKAWPTTRDQINAVRVTFTAGYGATAASVPEDIRHWIMVRAATLYEHREQIAVGAGLASATIPFMNALLDAYRLPVV